MWLLLRERFAVEENPGIGLRASFRTKFQPFSVAPMSYTTSSSDRVREKEMRFVPTGRSSMLIFSQPAGRCGSNTIVLSGASGSDAEDMLDQGQHDAVTGPCDREAAIVRHHFRYRTRRDAVEVCTILSTYHIASAVRPYLPSATACTPVEIVIIACFSTAESQGPYSPLFSRRILSSSGIARRVARCRSPWVLR